MTLVAAPVEHEFEIMLTGRGWLVANYALRVMIKQMTNPTKMQMYA